MSVTKAAAVFGNPRYADEKVFLLFTTPLEVVRLIESGVEVKTLNIGGMQFRDGKTQLNKAVFVTEDEARAFYRLRALGVELDLRVLKSDPPADIIAKIREKFGKDMG